MLFSFKQKSQDFIVEEELPFQLKHKGDAFFVYFEKRNFTTMEIVQFLCKRFNISRMTLGIAGLKDKDAITRQWISIYRSALKKLGGEHTFVNALSEMTKILKTDWHDKPIGMTSNIKNTFYIRLRANKKLSQVERQKTEQIISSLFEEGVPNIFGNQRFGVEERNRKMGKQILDGELKIKETFEAKFKLQAYASRLFNQYVDLRIKEKTKLFDGDILQMNMEDNDGSHQQLVMYNKSKNSLQKIQEKGDGKSVFSFPKTISEATTYTDEIDVEVTGPVIGFDLLMPELNTDSGKLEQKFLEKYGLNKDNMKAFQNYKIFGIRRKIWTYPQKAKHNFDGDDFLVQFTLGAGEYASVLIDALLKKLG